MPVSVDAKQKRLQIPYVKGKDGKNMQFFFTDVLEMEKFSKGKKVPALKIPFGKIIDNLVPDVDTAVLNPQGFNLPLTKEQLKRILGAVAAN